MSTDLFKKVSEKNDLPKLLQQYPPNYIVQKKIDGERVLIVKDKDRIFMKNRSGTVYEENIYPGLFASLKDALKGVEKIILDAELAMHTGQHFYNYLKERHNHGSEHLDLFIFDILYLNGIDQRDKKLTERTVTLKLKSNVSFNTRVKLVESNEASNIQEIQSVFREAVYYGYEGIVVNALALHF